MEPIETLERNMQTLLLPNEWSPAATKVFNTYELAEMIIVNLIPRDIITAMLICKATRDTVKSSKTIHSSLYWLRRMPSRWHKLEDFKGMHHGNPPLVFDNHQMTDVAPSAAYFVVSIIVWSGDAIDLKFHKIMTPFTLSNSSMCVTPMEGNDEALWRKMRVFGSRHETQGVTAWQRGPSKHIEFPQGVTLGEVYDWLCETVLSEAGL